MAEFSLGTAALGTEVSLDGLRSGMAKAEKEAKDRFSAIGESVNNAFNTVITRGALGAAAAVGAAAAGIFRGIQSNIQFEKFEAQFATLLGSTAAAQKQIAALSTFAAKTPFELPGVITAQKNLLVLGGAAAATQENLTLVGNAAAAAGQPIEEVSFWISRAYSAMQNGQPFGESAMRLQEMGILGGEARVMLEELQKEGAKGPELWAKFASSINAPTDAMDKLGKTWEGLTSTLTDNIDSILRTLTAPLFEAGSMR